MPEANYLLSVSWGYIKVCGAYLRSLWGYRVGLIIALCAVLSLEAKDRFGTDRLLLWARRVHPKIFPSLLEGCCRWWWGIRRLGLHLEPSAELCVCVCTRMQQPVINSCCCSVWVSVYSVPVYHKCFFKCLNHRRTVRNVQIAWNYVKCWQQEERLELRADFPLASLKFLHTDAGKMAKCPKYATQRNKTVKCLLRVIWGLLKSGSLLTVNANNYLHLNSFQGKLWKSTNIKWHSWPGRIKLGTCKFSM